MQKVWQWIRDRKTNTIRKWRSTFGFSSAASTSADPNIPYLEPILDVPESVTLQPIGGSDNALARIRSEKIRRQGSFFGRISKRLSPRNKSKKELNLEESNALLSSQSSQTNGSLEHDNQTLDSKKLFDSVHQCLNEIPSTSAGYSTPILKKRTEKTALSDSLEDVLSSDREKMADELFKHAVQTSKMTKKRDVKSVRERKRTRFIIPQVSISSFDESAQPVSTTVLYPASDQVEFSLDEKEEVDEDDIFEMDLSEVPKEDLENGKREPVESVNSYESSPREELDRVSSLRRTSDNEIENRETPPPRRSMTDVDKRRISLQQRRLSNVQLVQSVSGRRNSTTLIPLTAAQIHLVRALWRQVYLTKGPTVIGQTIIHRLFFKCTKTKEQFKRCPLPRNFPNHDSFSKAHCKAIAELIDNVVESLDNLENMSPDLEKLGRVHAQIMGGQLSNKLWNTVAETFIDCTLEWGDRRCRSETVRKAWALIVAYMIERIKIGHVEQVQINFFNPAFRENKF